MHGTLASQTKRALTSSLAPRLASPHLEREVAPCEQRSTEGHKGGVEVGSQEERTGHLEGHVQHEVRRLGKDKKEGRSISQSVNGMIQA